MAEAEVLAVIEVHINPQLTHGKVAELHFGIYECFGSGKEGKKEKNWGADNRGLEAGLDLPLKEGSEGFLIDIYKPW